MNTTDPPAPQPRLSWVVFFISAAVLGFEISLLRILLVASWHHFAFLVISLALLGFSASGSALFLLRRWIVPRTGPVLFLLVLLATASMFSCFSLAQGIPVEARIIPALVWVQIGYWTLFWSLLGIPFLLGAGVICLALMSAHDRVPRIYAANLLGSAAGSLLSTAAMSLVQPHWLPTIMAGVALVSVLGFRQFSTRFRSLLLGLGAAGITIGSLLSPPTIDMDQYKYGAYVQRLKRQGLASQLAIACGPRAVVEAVAGPAFHDLPFLSSGSTPPPSFPILTDGHLTGAVLDIRSADQADVVDHTLMAFPYDLLPRAPRVLLLGETAGPNVWLGARRQASSIDVVQPDHRLVEVVRDRLADRGGGVLALPSVRVVSTEPRHFVDHASRPYDLIQLVALESAPAGSGGIAGLGQDHLVTIEGLTAALRCLTDDGLLAATRGIQDPPRDNIKLLATITAALRRHGIQDPRRHIVIVRDYLAVCTVARTSPWTPQQIEQVRRSCSQRQLTPVWFDGLQPLELNTPDALPPPPNGVGDWYHYAATMLLSDSPGQFITQYAFDIRPPTDDRPFFLDFCKLRSSGRFRSAYGELWLTRTELAFLFVLASMVVVGIAGLLLTVLPILPTLRNPGTVGRFRVAAYFFAIGLAYMLLEMTLLSRSTFWIGDPITAAAVTIFGFLCFSGLGSLAAQHSTRSAAIRLRYIIPALMVVGLIEVLSFGSLSWLVGSWPPALRCAAVLAAIAPLAFLMGFPMPLGLARLEQQAPTLLPWAWCVNGFASVLATPLALALGMTWGFSLAGSLALALYLIPAFTVVGAPHSPNLRAR